MKTVNGDQLTEKADMEYIQWFRQSSPYINAHRGKTFVIMIPGEAVNDQHFAGLLQDIALLNSLGVKLVLVHGARPQIDALLKAQGHNSEFYNGLRVTNSAAVEAIKAAVGVVKADIESGLSVGIATSPLHGARIRVVSGNFVTAKPLGVIDGVDFHHTGDVRRIEVAAVDALLQQQNIVLLSCTGYSPSGEMFNLNVEAVAQHAAISLQADKLIILGASNGLMDDQQQTLRELTCRQLEQSLDSWQGESQQHANAALKTIRQGVPRVHLLSYQQDGALLQELFTRVGSGTLISQESYDQLRAADANDVNGILTLLQPLEDAGVLVRRSRELLETELHRFYVIERDGLITACAALYPYSAIEAELACVAVHPDYRGSHRGARLLQQIEDEAQRRNYQRIFVLTTQAAHWFIEHGFSEGAVEQLPAERQRLYNYQRNSKIFLKQLGRR